jgi:hypothetical protein
LHYARHKREAKHNGPYVALAISKLLDKPTRWATGVVGDYDGRDRTIEVFCAAAEEQRSLGRRLRPLAPLIEAAIGGPAVYIFHTPAETRRLYSEVATCR